MREIKKPNCTVLDTIWLNGISLSSSDKLTIIDEQTVSDAGIDFQATFTSWWANCTGPRTLIPAAVGHWTSWHGIPPYSGRNKTTSLAPALVAPVSLIL